MSSQPVYSFLQSWNPVRESCVWSWWSGGLLSCAESCNFLLKIVNGRHPLGWDTVLGGRKCRDQWLRRWRRAFQWEHDEGHFWQFHVLLAHVWTVLATHGGGRLPGLLSFSEGTAGGRTGVDDCTVSDFYFLVPNPFPEISKGEKNL